MKRVLYFVLMGSVCLIEQLHADRKELQDYALTIKKYQQYYIPAGIIEKVFDKRTIYRKANVYTRTPMFTVTKFFDNPSEGVTITNRITGENLMITAVQNQYDAKKKCYSGSDGIGVESKIYPLVENPHKGSYTYFSEATYRKGAKVRGYFIMDLRIRQVNDITELRVESFFQLADPLVSAVAFALRGNRTFEVWINRIIDDTIEFLSLTGQRATEGYYQECKNRDNIPWIPG